MLFFLQGIDISGYGIGIKVNERSARVWSYEDRLGMVSCRLGRLKCFVVKCRHGGSRVDYGHIQGRSQGRIPGVPEPPLSRQGTYF